MYSHTLWRWLLNPFRFFLQKCFTLHFVTSINISIILFELQIFTPPKQKHRHKASFAAAVVISICLNGIYVRWWVSVHGFYLIYSFITFFDLDCIRCSNLTTQDNCRKLNTKFWSTSEFFDKVSKWQKQKLQVFTFELNPHRIPISSRCLFGQSSRLNSQVLSCCFFL